MELDVVFNLETGTGNNKYQTWETEPSVYFSDHANSERSNMLLQLYFPEGSKGKPMYVKERHKRYKTSNQVYINKI